MVWTLQDAKNRFSAVVEALQGVPQKVTRRGVLVSVVSIGEIERGLARQRVVDAAFYRQLASWLDRLLRSYGDRLLPVDVGARANRGDAQPSAFHADGCANRESLERSWHRLRRAMKA